MRRRKMPTLTLITLQVLFLPIAFANHHAQKMPSTLQIDGTIVLLGGLRSDRYVLARCHVVGRHQSAAEHHLTIHSKRLNMSTKR